MTTVLETPATPHLVTPGRLYLVVRADLPVGVAAAQIAHVSLLAAQAWPHVREWAERDGYVIVCAARDEAHLEVVREDLFAHGVESVTFTDEFASGAQDTALVAFPHPSTQVRLASLPLWGKTAR